MSLHLPASGSFLVRRGGCWCIVPQFARVADRYYKFPGSQDDGLGVRLIRRFL